MTEPQLPASGSQPGYLKQTFTSSTPLYSHYGNERIRNAFSSASCWSVKAIPSKLDPHSLQDARLARLADVRSHRPQKRDLKQLRVFSPFQYGFHDYEAAKVKAKREADLRELNLISFSRKPFRLSSSKVKLLHEDIIDNENFVYPTLGPSDGKLAYRGRAAELDRNKPAYGLFRPGGRATKDQQRKEEGRGSVPEWSRRMFFRLSEDWPQLRFTLRFTTEDEFVVSFDASAPLQPTQEDALAENKRPVRGAIDVLSSLNRYMKHFATHGLASEFRLIKRGDRWNCLELSAPHEMTSTQRLSPGKGPCHAEGRIAMADVRSSSAIDTGRRLRFEDVEGNEALAPIVKTDDDRHEQPSPFQDTRGMAPESVVVYSFYAPWVTFAGSKSRKVESLRSRAMARTGSLHLARTLSPLDSNRSHEEG